MFYMLSLLLQNVLDLEVQNCHVTNKIAFFFLEPVSQRCSVKNVVPKNFAKYTRKNLCRYLYCN